MSTHFYNLRSHPVRCASKWIIFLSLCEFSRDTEIRQLDHSIFSCQDVASFDVSMNHSLPVQVLETFENLLDIDCDQSLWKTAELFIQVLKAASLDKLKNDA